MLPDSDQAACLALARYIDGIPERFYNRSAESEFRTWIAEQSRVTAFVDGIGDERSSLDRAYRTLAEINTQNWHDELLGSDVDQLRLLDRHVHPTYLRLAEGVLGVFLLLPARISRRQRGKSTAGLDVFNVIDELRQDLPNTVAGYNHRVRNAIAHGGVSYVDSQVVYTDRDKSEAMSRESMIRLTDNMLDICNALGLALKLFLLARGVPRNKWPQEVLLHELQAATATPWWNIEACLPSRSAKGAQLNIHVAVNTSLYSKALYSSIQTAAFASRLAPGFDRYFLSLRSRDALPGWAGFDGKLLARAAEIPDAELPEYARALEDGLVFYVPHKKLPDRLGFIDSLLISLQLQARHTIDTYWSSRTECDTDVRIIERHRDPWLVTRAWVVVDKATVASIRSRAAEILERVRLSKLGFVSIVPAGYTQVCIYRTDYRRRRLRGYGLGPDLVCTLTKTQDPQKQHIDIIGSRVEVVGDIRIAWNTNWPQLGNHLSEHLRSEQ